MLAEALAASVSVGLGCGTCCGSSASSFLAVYILTEGGGFKSSLKHVGGYFFGKILAVCSITALCSAIGRVFIDENGYIGSFNLHHAVSWVMLASALFLIRRWLQSRKQTCAKCGGKCHSDNKSRLIPSFTVGLAYGAYPWRRPARRGIRSRKLAVAGACDIRTVGRPQRKNQNPARQSHAVDPADSVYFVFSSCSGFFVLV